MIDMIDSAQELPLGTNLLPSAANQSLVRTLRPHQHAAIDMLRQAFVNGHKRVVLQMATGSGKSFVASQIILMAKKKNPAIRVMFSVPMITLIDQTIAEFEREGINDIGVIQADHQRKNRDASVQIASVQTLARRDAGEFGLCIVDEAHISSRAISQMMVDQPACRFVGLSATPWRKGMGHEWDHLCVAATTADLIKSGVLADFRVYAPDMPNMDGARVIGGDYTEEASETAMRPIIGNVVGTWLRLGKNQPTLGFAVNRVSAKDMQARFERAGIASGYIDGFTDPIERRLIKGRFISGEIKVIWSVRTMTTGVDLPVGCVIDCAPTLSEMLHVQRIGRGLRVNPGVGDSEGRAIIIDHAGNTASLGFVTDICHYDFVKGKRSEAEERERKEKLPKPCSKCDFMIPVSVSTCPNCGAERALPPPRETLEGELVEVKRGGTFGDTLTDKQRFYSMALSYGARKNWPDKRIAGMYFGRFGSYPSGLRDVFESPDQDFLNYELSQRIRYAKLMEKKRAGK